MDKLSIDYLDSDLVMNQNSLTMGAPPKERFLNVWKGFWWLVELLNRMDASCL